MQLTPTEPFDGAAVDRGQGPSRTSCLVHKALYSLLTPYSGRTVQVRRVGQAVRMYLGRVLTKAYVRKPPAHARPTPSDSYRIRGRRCSGTWTAQSPRKPAGKRDGSLFYERLR